MAEPDEDAAPPRRVRVLLPLPLAGAYDYLADAALGLAPGDPVRVPLGARVALGVVWDAAPEPDAAEAIPAARLTWAIALGQSLVALFPVFLGVGIVIIAVLLVFAVLAGLVLLLGDRR